MRQKDKVIKVTGSSMGVGAVLDVEQFARIGRNPIKESPAGTPS
jgi:hypothetical protein